MSRDAASERQVQAADPAASTWLSANAGSGKTRVLTDRVARLLLDGVAPQHILCLTYTRAAASEMQNRLFRRLGEWAMLPDGDLRAALAGLGVAAAADAPRLAAARRLFARAIETPGGLRIQTIHSFCAGLLRRFPLEARVPPDFTEMDDRTAALLRDEVVEALAGGADPAAVDAAARFLSAADFRGLTEEIVRHRDGFAAALDRAAALTLFGLPDSFDTNALLAEVFTGGEAALVRGILPALAAGSSNDQKAHDKLALAGLDPPRMADLALLEEVLLTGKTAKSPFTARIGAFPTRATRDRLGPLLPPLDALMARVEAARPRRLALAAAERAAALHRFATAFLPAYEAAKAARGLLDFDDLIRRTRALLTDPGVAQWVLFKLDGGIDHILIDEAQDTSPAQWQVIEALAQEFTAGDGARPVARTIFVVGDKKQSIYSFQGADLSVFDKMQAAFRDRLAAVQQRLEELVLEYSFRSAEPVLRLVDTAFDGVRAPGLGTEVRHRAFHADLPGRVDLWPPVEPADPPERGDWFAPIDLRTDTDAPAVLAGHVADEIARLIAAGTRIPHKDGARPLRAGDVLILVQRRGPLFHEIIRACKDRGLPIAGADRLRLGGEMAVRDIAAVLAFLATPEDDLSLAAALRSPLFGWSEDALFRLAHGRTGYLWAALRVQDVPARSVLQDLRDQADYLRPYDLIERLLTRHDGRRRLIARLGAEAEDGIDALLSQALAYERTEVPSLTGFLTWLDAEDPEVKRRPDSAGDRLRVMTVHGAKGLEAPLVILPDTHVRPNRVRDEILEGPGGVALWKTPTDARPQPVADAHDALARRQEEERARLLYVAITRAETWLIVCAAGKVGTFSDSWHAQIAGALDACGAVPTPMPTGLGLRLQANPWPADDAADASPPRDDADELPAWADARAPACPHPPEPLSPSALGGAKALPGEGQESAVAMARGTALHALLEHLPDWPRADWPAVAAGLVPAGAPGPEGGHIATMAADDLLVEAVAVMDAHQALFAPGTLAEVDIAAQLPAFAPRPILGTIDRLVVGPDRVLAVDYKSNTIVPARPADVPEGLLRQMGAYAAALAAVYPDRKIEVAILWTRTAALMPLPPDLVNRALATADAAAP